MVIVLVIQSQKSCFLFLTVRKNKCTKLFKSSYIPKLTFSLRGDILYVPVNLFLFPIVCELWVNVSEPPPHACFLLSLNASLPWTPGRLDGRREDSGVMNSSLYLLEMRLQGQMAENIPQLHSNTDVKQLLQKQTLWIWLDNEAQQWDAPKGGKVILGDFGANFWVLALLYFISLDL